MTNKPIDTEEEELQELDRQAQRPPHGEGVDVTIFEAVRAQSATPVHPVQLKPTDTFFFRCHRGVSCWNACCHGADVTLTPYDILRLSRRLELRPAEFLARYTVPAEHEASGMPVAKLKMTGDDGKGPCSFMAEEGCTVYSDRPQTCRYYPLGLVSHKLKDAEAKEDFHFLVKEPHCKGHLEAVSQTVEEFRREQGVIPYEQVNRGWVDILMKLASWRSLGGPMGRSPALQTKKMFFMVSTDVDAFRRFVFESRFLQTYEIDAEVVERLRSEDELLLQLGFDWMKNVLFNEPTIRLREDVMQAAIAKTRSEIGGG